MSDDTIKVRVDGDGNITKFQGWSAPEGYHFEVDWKHRIANLKPLNICVCDIAPGKACTCHVAVRGNN